MKTRWVAIAMILGLSATGCESVKPDKVQAALIEDLNSVQCAQIESLNFHYKYPVSSSVQAQLNVTDIECYKRAVRKMIDTLAANGAELSVTSMYVYGQLPNGDPLSTTAFGVREKASAQEILDQGS